MRLDPGRAARTGIPEFILAGSKSLDEVERSLRSLAGRIGRATATRCRDDQLDIVPSRLADLLSVEIDREARAITAFEPDAQRPRTGGRIGIITAGSSDRPVAAEAAVVAREMGCEVFDVRDVGVAGLHRLVRPLEGLADADVHTIIVVAGMDGALPSVVAGLVPVPVIGLPTSVGYGFGGNGTGALSTMLQSCAPGLVVVNIDNGVGAGSAAAKIANQVAAATGSC
ncbi:MAG: nickel pincer cofactor biosynthesis protein LarB [Thermomicrobiales bacterium]|nr:nickel pincer cofactor biosynthesis protein LarB [Thermomicrobiales bacterium]